MVLFLIDMPRTSIDHMSDIDGGLARFARARLEKG